MFHIYIVSLAEDVPRREHVIKLREKLIAGGAQCTIVDAFFWKSHNIRNLLEERGFTIGGGLAQSQMACFLSHYTVWEIIAKSDPAVHSIVLEDDMDISDSFNLAELEQSLQSLPLFEAILLWKHPEQENNKIPFNEWFSKYSYTWGLAAYMMTPDFAKKETALKFFDKPADEQMSIRYNPDKTFIANKRYFKNLGFMAGNRDYGPYVFKSNIWG